MGDWSGHDDDDHDHQFINSSIHHHHHHRHHPHHHQYQSVTYRYQEFFIFFVVSEPVLEQIGTGKESRDRYQNNLVPELIFVRKIQEF